MTNLKKILVTGADGQLGLSIRRLSGAYPFSFIFTDYQELDITSKEKVDDFFARIRPDFVINCAAYTAVDKAESEPEKAELLNSTAVSYLTDASAVYDAVLIHLSTDYVFDGKNPQPIEESQNTDPVSVYGRTKEMGEHPVLSYEKGIVIRTAWLYSEYGTNFVKTMLRLGAEKERIGVVCDQTGSPTYAGDLAEAILKIVSVLSEEVSSGKERYGVFHYSNEGECSWCDFARAVMQIAGLKCDVSAIRTSEYPSAAVRPQYSLLSKDKIKRIYGVTVSYWLDSLKKDLAAGI